MPGGPSDVPISVTPEGNLDVSWVVSSSDLQGNEVTGPVKAFYLRVHNDGTDTVPIWAKELPFSSRSTVVSGLGPGTYTVCIFELNDSGLGGLCPGAVTIHASPSPSPSSSATPSPTSTS